MTSLERLQALEREQPSGPVYAVINDLVGGWMVATVDKPAHAIDTRKGSSEYVIADFLSEAEARFLAALRNAAPDLIAVAVAAQKYSLTFAGVVKADLDRALAPLLESEGGE